MAREPTSRVASFGILIEYFAITTLRRHQKKFGCGYWI